MSPPNRLPAVAVYCGASLGKEKAYQYAALSIGRALAKADRALIYGGGSHGIMGIVSGAAVEAGGKVTGVRPSAMVAAGGEKAKSKGEEASEVIHHVLNEVSRDNVENITVGSMHQRKVEMARRAGGFVGLPGGFGTFEEICEVITWTQIGIHTKPVVLVNVLSYWEPFRELIKHGIGEGFIRPQQESLVVFVDGPSDPKEHATYNWGKATVEALDSWVHSGTSLFDWSAEGEPLDST